MFPIWIYLMHIDAPDFCFRTANGFNFHGLRINFRISYIGLYWYVLKSRGPEVVTGQFLTFAGGFP